jgi:DNA topoisomerase-1
MSKLIVVESPAKAKTINKYLGKDYIVKASVGHVKNLPKSKIGVDVGKEFEADYHLIKGKGKVLEDIKKAAKEADAVFLAPDPDREGEAIAWHIAEEIGEKGKIYRVLFNEITKNAIQEAIKHPGKLDLNRYEAQQTRRILDRLVGYMISPILWDKVKRGLSAGRVQSVSVRLICDREREIQAFVPEEYWTVTAELEGKRPPVFEARLTHIKGKKADLRNEGDSKSIVEGLKGASYIVKKVERKERKRYPSPPFITSKLQQEGARKLRFTAKKTMMMAQRLYEGVELGKEGPTGLITYMRTDSTRVAGEALASVRDFILKKYGKEYLPEKALQYKVAKAAQEAHEAIRPTSLSYTPEKVRDFLTKDEFNLYELIWNRFVASQMNPAILDQTSVDIAAGDATFRATGSVVKFPGFMSVYIEGKDTEEEEKEGRLPELKEGEELKLIKLKPEQHFTEPPPRFTEATLVKELEEKGIGRPSTYASIISTIQEKEYVKLEKRVFHPSELGFIVTDLLVKNFPDIMDVKFTAQMEEKLDDIEEGKEKRLKVLRDFYGPFETTVKAAQKGMRDVKREEIPTDIVCEKCGSMMVIKWGRMGQFLACSNYPECKNIRNFRRVASGKIEVVEEKVEVTGEICPKCGKPMVVKTGRFGKFIACSDYPTCKTTKPLTTGVKCPDCGKGEITEKRSKKGKVFYSCSRYPECKFATWNRPVPEICPHCSAPFLVEKYSKSEGNYLACIKEGCGYKKVTSNE